MIKRLESIGDPIKIYIETLSTISKLIPNSQDLLMKVINGVREQHAQQKASHKTQLSNYQKRIEDLQE
jgi:hypothetical protein